MTLNEHDQTKPPKHSEVKMKASGYLTEVSVCGPAGILHRVHLHSHLTFRYSAPRDRYLINNSKRHILCFMGRNSMQNWFLHYKQDYLTVAQNIINTTFHGHPNSCLSQFHVRLCLTFCCSVVCAAAMEKNSYKAQTFDTSCCHAIHVWIYYLNNEIQSTVFCIYTCY